MIVQHFFLGSEQNVYSPTSSSQAAKVYQMLCIPFAPNSTYTGVNHPWSSPSLSGAIDICLDHRQNTNIFPNFTE